MSIFKHWPHMDNLYQIDKQALKDHANDVVYITEKCDGCNLCLGKEPNQDWRIFSRNGEDWSQNRDVKTAMERLKLMLNSIDFAVSKQYPYINGYALYGELVNSQKLHRLWYGDKKPQILLFGFAIRTEIGWRFKNFQDLINVAIQLNFTAHPTDMTRFVVPILNKKRLKDINFEQLSQNSVLTENGICEGVVLHNISSDLSFKFKFAGFEEKAKLKPTAEELELKRTIKGANSLFVNYFTEQRVYSVLSKMSATDAEEIPKVVKALTVDATEDFMKDHPEFVGHEELKKILNVGSKGFLLVKKVLSKQNE